MQANSGNLVGICGGDNSDARALANGARAATASPIYKTPAGGIASLAIVAFPSPEKADGYMKQTLGQSQCSRAFKVKEGTKEGQVKNFGNSKQDGKSTWDYEETVSVGSLKVVDADESFLVDQERIFSTYLYRTKYGAKDINLVLFERHDRVVLIYSLSGQCCHSGYNNIDTLTVYTPDVGALQLFADSTRQAILEQLLSAQVISGTTSGA